jgi:hypothetical protein
VLYVYVKIVLKLAVGITLTEKITDSLTGTAPKGKLIFLYVGIALPMIFFL